MVRVQVLLSEEEREAFRLQAEKEGTSLSAWLLEAARRHLEEEAAPRLKSTRDLKRFFADCRKREAGREPDWDAHLSMIAESKASGGSRT